MKWIIIHCLYYGWTKRVIFLRKDYFNKIGGYKEIPLMEDVQLMQRIKKRGDRICILSEKVLTSPRRWEKEGTINHVKPPPLVVVVDINYYTSFYADLVL